MLTVHFVILLSLYHFTRTAHKQLCCPLTVITVPFHRHSTQTAVLSTDCYHCTISLAQHTNSCAVHWLLSLYHFSGTAHKFLRRPVTCLSNGGRDLVSRTRTALSSAPSRITIHPPCCGVSFTSLQDVPLCRSNAVSVQCSQSLTK